MMRGVTSAYKLSGVVARMVSQQRGLASQVDGLIAGAEGPVYRIQFNRPEKFNAITEDMYRGITEALEEANNDKNTKITVFSGAGPYYSSGNDLSSFLKARSPEEFKAKAEDGAVLLQKFLDTFIDHDKPIIGLVNGPAIGIAVTTLPLFDVVVASDSATFQTPFTALGYSPEGCSSYTFPQIMGISKANEMLIFGRTLTADEAFQSGLVSRVIPSSQFSSETKKIIEGYAKLPAESLRVNKTAVRDLNREKLHKVNKDECTLICKRWQGKDCADAMKKFMTRKN